MKTRKAKRCRTISCGRCGCDVPEFELGETIEHGRVCLPCFAVVVPAVVGTGSYVRPAVAAAG